MAARSVLVAYWERVRSDAQSKIDEAYWAFTRQRRAKPPVLVVPRAYYLRDLAERRLRELNRSAA